MKTNILITISQWVAKNFGLKESLKKISTEVLKEYLCDPLKKKIMTFFTSDEEAQKFVEQLFTTEATNEKKPKRDVEDLYEELKGEIPTDDLFNIMVAFFKDNQDLIKDINTISNNSSGNNIYHQTAEQIINSDKVESITFYSKYSKESK